jgi:hypothetical protein
MNTMAQAQSIAQTIIDGLDKNIRVSIDGRELTAEGAGIKVQAKTVTELNKAVARAVIERDGPQEASSGEGAA